MPAVNATDVPPCLLLERVLAAACDGLQHGSSTPFEDLPLHLVLQTVQYVPSSCSTWIIAYRIIRFITAWLADLPATRDPARPPGASYRHRAHRRPGYWRAAMGLLGTRYYNGRSPRTCSCTAYSWHERN